MNNPQGKRLIPEYLLKYLEEVKNTYPEASKIVSKKYKHYITFTYDTNEYLIIIENDNNTALTSDSIKNYIKALGENVKYPIQSLGKFEGEYVPGSNFFHVKNYNYITIQSMGGMEVMTLKGSDTRISATLSNSTILDATSSLMGGMTITSQYAIEV